MSTFFTRLISTFVAGIGASAIAANWSGWRGSEGTGITAEKDLPLKWTTTENVRWRVDLPERGNSSPIVWEDRVFVTQAVTTENRRTLMCFDRANGKLLWQSGVTYTEREPTQRDNPFCSATPVTDGERVIASFGSAGLYCYDFAGKELWHRDVGKMNHMFGNAASPVLAGELCILNFGPDEKARLIAVQKRTGQTVWEASPPKIDPSEQAQMRGGPGAGPGGGGAPPGRGGFGPGMMLAPQMLSQADKNGDRKVSSEEFANLAASWFNQIDKEKTGKVDQQTFADRLNDLLPAPQGFAPPGIAAGDGDRGRRGGGFARFIAPGMFAVADADKDGALTRTELQSAFAKWFRDWDDQKSDALDEGKLADGLTAVLPRPQFGGPGGGGRGPGGPGGPGGFGGGGGPGGSWSTPILVKADNHEELVVGFPNRLAAYDLLTGKPLWFSKGIGGTIYTTPVWGDGVLFAVSSGPGGGGAIAVKPGGTGDVTESQRVWRMERAKSAIGSGVIREGYLFTISQEGIATCTDLKNGNTVWEERLKGSGSRGSSWSSMILSDDRIYVPNQSGDVFVLRAGPKFELLATNSINEPTNASLAASNNDLFLRTDKALWCLTASK